MHSLVPRRFALLGLALLVLMSGCVFSRNPLSSPNDAAVDESLCGFWDHADRPQVEMLVVGRSSAGNVPKGMMVLRTIKIDQDKNVEIETPMLFFISKIGNDEYWNLIVNPTPDKDTPPDFLTNFDFDEWSKHPKRAYMIVRVVREKNRLTLRHLNTEALAKAVAAHKLKGEIERDAQKQEVKSVTLTDSTENLRAFLKTADKDIFAADSDAEYRKRK